MQFVTPDTADPTLWLSRTEQFLRIPPASWAASDKMHAVELLTVAIALLKCKVEVPKDDVQLQVVQRAQCLAQCAEDLARDIVAVIPAVGAASTVSP